MSTIGRLFTIRKSRRKKAARRYFNRAAEAFTNGEVTLELAIGEACSFNFHTCVDLCCAAAYALFAKVPAGFNDAAGDNLLQLCARLRERKTKLAPETLSAIEALARVGRKFGGSTRPDIPAYKLSDVVFLKRIYDASTESTRLAKQILAAVG